MENMITMGFATGDLYRLYSDRDEQEFSSEYIDYFKLNGFANALELHCRDENALDRILDQRPDFSDFRYLSLHAPVETSDEAIIKMEILTERHGIDNFVFHIDKPVDWDLLSNSIIPVSIENMDDGKSSGQSLNDVALILDRYNFGLTLDLQHCFVNDDSMKLAEDIQDKFGHRIVEYHISGFEKELIHFPLFKTGQNEIIGSLRERELPIIIESIFQGLEEMESEFSYIRKKLTR